jgi:cobalt-zinc-cadmium efflux system outer membrane protein
VTSVFRATFAVGLALLVTNCASIPKDSGFGDVSRAVEAETRQPLTWDSHGPIAHQDDAVALAMLKGALTADRAVQVAFTHNRDLQATLEELGIARSELMAASTIRNPLLEGEVRFPARPSNPFEIGISQTLMDIFTLGSRKKLGRLQFEATKLRVGGAIIHFAAQVRMDYYDLLAARKLLALQDTIFKAQEATVELVRRQHAAGNISDLDLENEQSRYEQVKLDHARAQLDELQARESLTADLGLATLAELTLPDDFDVPGAADQEASDVEREAVNRRLDIRIARQDIDAAKQALSLSKTAPFDELSAGGHQEREADGAKTTGPAVTIPIPIFDHGAASKARARAMLRQAQQRLAALIVNARSEARGALERLVEARSRMEYLRDVVIPRRDRILKLTQLEYNAMLRSVFQLLEARQSLAQAQREEVIATRDYWVVRAELETALLGVSGFSVRPDQEEPSRRDRFVSSDRQGKKEKH